MPKGAKLALEIRARAERESEAKSKETGKTLESRTRELAQLREDLATRETELEASKRIEADLLKAKRDFENEKRQMPVTIQQKVDEETRFSKRVNQN